MVEPGTIGKLHHKCAVVDARRRDVWEQEITTLRHLNQARGTARDDLLEQLEGVE